MRLAGGAQVRRLPEGGVLLRRPPEGALARAPPQGVLPLQGRQGGGRGAGEVGGVPLQGPVQIRSNIELAILALEVGLQKTEQSDCSFRTSDVALQTYCHLSDPQK